MSKIGFEIKVNKEVKKQLYCNENECFEFIAKNLISLLKKEGRTLNFDDIAAKLIEAFLCGGKEVLSKYFTIQVKEQNESINSIKLIIVSINDTVVAVTHTNNKDRVKYVEDKLINRGVNLKETKGKVSTALLMDKFSLGTKEKIIIEKVLLNLQ